MYKNYYLFKSQTSWLRSKIKKYIILECFTYLKSELILRINLKEEYFLHISIDSSHPYLFLSNARNIKESKVSLFKDLNGQIINDILIDDSDKIVTILTDKFELKSIFYGSVPNIILNDNKKIEISRFKKDKSPISIEDKTFQISPKILQLDSFLTLSKKNIDLNIVKLISRNINGFNYTLAREACFRSNIHFDSFFKDLSKEDIPLLISNINMIYSEVNSPKPLIYFNEEYPKFLSIIELKHIEKNLQSKDYETLNEAWKYFTRQSIKLKSIENLTRHFKNVLSKKTDYLQSTLAKIQEFEKLEERKEVSELKGNLLLTFINKIPPGSKSVELINIFSDDNEKITIKLNPAKSVQANAQKYFTKFKDIDIQKNRINNRKSVLIKELESLIMIQKQFEQINSDKDAIRFQDILMQKNLIQSEPAKKLKIENKEKAFRNIVLNGKWNVFLGKNDQNNDLLTFNFAHKYDWWFHAQGIPGSHVILRLNNKDENPPSHIVTEVASLAAFNSSAKHSTAVPVIYTQVRYVKRIRKANPGTVSVLQHKTIFVEPKNL